MTKLKKTGLIVFLNVVILGFLAVLFIHWSINRAFPFAPDKDKFDSILFDGKRVVASRTIETLHDTKISCNIEVDGVSIAKYELKNGQVYDNYDLENDFEDNWCKIIKKHKSANVMAYRFHWGILYSTDSGNTVNCVPKHEYTYVCNTDKIFCDIYNKLS